MNKEVIKLKNKLIFFQGLVLALIMASSVILFCDVYLKWTSHIWLNDLDKTTQLLLTQIRKQVVPGAKNQVIRMSLESIEGDLTEEEYTSLIQGGETLSLKTIKRSDIDGLKENIVRSVDETYGDLVFIIKGESSFVIPRNDLEKSDAKIWEKHRTKLVYEMVKQRRGWIFYPDKKKGEFNRKQKVIRYLPIEELDWIVAVEGEKGGVGKMLGPILNVKVVLSLIGVFFVGFLSLRFVTEKIFGRIEKILEDFNEGNYGFRRTSKKKDNENKGFHNRQETVVVKEILRAEIGEIQRVQEKKPMAKSVPPGAGEPTAAEIDDEDKNLSERDRKQPEDFGKIEQYFSSLVGRSKPSVEEKGVEADSAEIKSPLLKEMMHEFKK